MPGRAAVARWYYYERYRRYCLKLVTGEVTMGGGTVGLWWVPIGLAAWFAVAVAIALCAGPVLRRCSAVRESIDQRWGEISDEYESPQDQQAGGPAVVRPRSLHVEAELHLLPV